MKKKLIGVLLAVIALAVAMAGCSGCDGNVGPDTNIADKVFKVDSVARFVPGTGLWKWSASGKDEDGKNIDEPSIVDLKSNTMDSNNWESIFFEWKTTAYKVTTISFEVIAEGDCSFILAICKTSGTTRFGSVEKNLKAGEKVLFEFTNLELTKDVAKYVVIAHDAPEYLSDDEYENAGGYTTKWKITNFKVLGEKI